MKVSINYVKYHSIEIKIDDKYKDWKNDDNLYDELMDQCEEAVPYGVEIVSIFDDDTDNLIYDG